MKKIKYLDADGQEGAWEVAERKTRKSTGIDGGSHSRESTACFVLINKFDSKAVAVLGIIRSKTNAFPLSTVIIEQYRPPVDKFIIGTPSTTLSLTHVYGGSF